VQRKASFLAWLWVAAIAVVAVLLLLFKAGGDVGGGQAGTDAWVPLASVGLPGAGAETTVTGQPATTGPPTTVAVTVTAPPTTVVPPASTGPPTTGAVTTSPPPTSVRATNPPTSAPRSTSPPTTTPRRASPPTTAPLPTRPPTTAPRPTRPPTTAPATTAPAVIVPNTLPPGTSPPGPGAGGSGAIGPGSAAPNLWLALPLLLGTAGVFLWLWRAPSSWPSIRSLAVGWHRHASRRPGTLGRPASPSPPAPQRDGGWKPPLPGTNGLAAGRAPHRFGIDVSGLRSVPPPDMPVFTGRDDPDLPV
jgi:outer membrane biosynthesis protein TonB